MLQAGPGQVYADDRSLSAYRADWSGAGELIRETEIGRRLTGPSRRRSCSTFRRSRHAFFIFRSHLEILLPFPCRESARSEPQRSELTSLVQVLSLRDQERPQDRHASQGRHDARRACRGVCQALPPPRSLLVVLGFPKGARSQGASSRDSATKLSSHLGICRAFVAQTKTTSSTSSSPAPRLPPGYRTPPSSPRSTWTQEPAPSPPHPLQASPRRNPVRTSTSLRRFRCCRVGMGAGFRRRWGRGERMGEGRRRSRGLERGWGWRDGCLVRVRL